MPVSVDHARKIIFAQACPCAVLPLPLLNAFGYCLAEDVVADRDLPPSDRSAMDGYAVRSSDVHSANIQLECIGEIAAGTASQLTVTSGTCVQVYTGAAVPPGADTIIKVEETSVRDGQITFCAAASPGANIRRQGEECKKGGIIIEKNMILDPVHIGLCASVGKNKVSVYGRPRVIVLCTGNELRGINETVETHQIRNSNGPFLCSALSREGYSTTPYLTVTDNLEELVERIREAIHISDVLIITGGVSMGKYDYVPEAVMQAGATVEFHGVTMKPGRPMLYAVNQGTCHIFGLPGNPLSVLTCLHEFVLPALRRMSGIPLERCNPRVRLPLAEPIHIKGGRTEYIPARLEYTETGSCVHPVQSHGSADLAAAADADGVIAVNRDTREQAKGDMVDFISWRHISCT